MCSKTSLLENTLPHAHIVVKLQDLPTVQEDREAAIDWIDTIISECMPPNNHGGSTGESSTDAKHLRLANVNAVRTTLLSKTVPILMTKASLYTNAVMNQTETLFHIHVSCFLIGKVMQM